MEQYRWGWCVDFSPIAFEFRSFHLSCQMETHMASAGVIARSIRTKLSSLNPIFVDVINESYKHNVPKGSESHFKGTGYIHFG